jgi:hypothetical protein
MIPQIKNQNFYWQTNHHLLIIYLNLIIKFKKEYLI